MSMVWVAVGTAVIGAGTSIYGANKQAKATQAAANTNAASQDAQNAQAWSNYLLTRGLSPNGAAPGTLPSNATAVNSRLPLWANASFASGPKRWVKKGSTGNPVGTLATALPSYNGGVADPALAVSPAASASKPGAGQKIANLLDPLNVSVGKNKNFLDPLGIFG